jgi:hypothetical protein
MGKDSPATRSGLFGVDGNDDALGTKGGCRFGNQVRFSERRRIHADLVGARQQHLANIRDCANTATDRKRHEAFFSCSFHYIEHCAPIIRRSGDVKKHEFIRALAVIFDRTFDRIACIPQLEKLCAFNDPSFGHIQAWNNTLGQHLTLFR